MNNRDGTPMEINPLDQTLHPNGDIRFNPNDVLCGRGKTAFKHEGNRRFRDAVMASVDEYVCATSRLHKAVMVHRVVVNMKTTGGRFLKINNVTGKWYELDDRQAKEKVGHAIRDAASMLETKTYIRKPKELVVIAVDSRKSHKSQRGLKASSSFISDSIDSVLPSLEHRTSDQETKAARDEEFLEYINDALGPLPANPVDPLHQNRPKY